MPVSIRPFHHLPVSYFWGFWSLIILLFPGSGLAYAEWVLISLTKREGGMTCTPIQTLFAAKGIW